MAAAKKNYNAGRRCCKEEHWEEVTAKWDPWPAGGPTHSVGGAVGAAAPAGKRQMAHKDTARARAITPGPAPGPAPAAGKRPVKQLAKMKTASVSATLPALRKSCYFLT